jgi:RNA polymerase sigma-70 factor (ECF subfamily)
MNSTSSDRETRVRASFVHLSDEALLAQIARGDEAALGALYDRFGRIVYGLALRVVRNAQLAEEATQEAFLAVWRTADEYRASRGSARAWLLTIAHRRAVDRVRYEQRRVVVNEPLDETTQDQIREIIPSAEDEAWVVFERERLVRALARIPDAERELIELAYFDGYTQTQLAERLGLPLGTVKRRTFNGLRRLRELLEAEG